MDTNETVPTRCDLCSRAGSPWRCGPGPTGTVRPRAPAPRGARAAGGGGRAGGRRWRPGRGRGAGRPPRAATDVRRVCRTALPLAWLR